MKIGDLVRAKEPTSAYRFGIVTGLAENGRYCWVNFMSVGHDKWFKCDMLEDFDGEIPTVRVVKNIEEENDWDCTPTGEQK